jgi:DNA-binding transcriptional LysR family regulator
MDLRQLQLFVGVAEALNFRKAAQQLGIVQPALTKAIQRLEASLGARLLDRTRHRVSLTPAGAALLSEARRLLAQAAFARNAVTRIAAGDYGTLRIGYSTASMFEVLPKALQKFRIDWPHVGVELMQTSESDQIIELGTGNLDLGFMSQPAMATPDLASRVVAHYRVVAGVAESSPLAKRKSLKLTDLAASNWIAPTAEAHREQRFIESCRKAGFEPRVAQRGAWLYARLDLITAGFGIGLVPDIPRLRRFPGLKLIPITDLPRSVDFEVLMLWSPNFASTPLRALLEKIPTKAADHS